jgi:hypothetical protein
VRTAAEVVLPRCYVLLFFSTGFYSSTAEGNACQELCVVVTQAFPQLRKLDMLACFQRAIAPLQCIAWIVHTMHDACGELLCGRYLVECKLYVGL